MTVRLTTFGGLHIAGDDGELDAFLGRRLRAALFVYLAVERRVPRSSLTAIFWPERGEQQARHALRQGLYDLRRTLGGDRLDATPHEVHVGAAVHADVHAFAAALERRDAEAAAKLYRGPFLDGIHLVDRRSWEGWVDGRRAEYARAFRRACREWLSAKRTAGDLAGAVEAAQHWVAPDPFDDEAQHKLIETLAEAGERAEAIRQYETYARLLEPDGLRPLDATVALDERVRSGAVVWPDGPLKRSTTPDATAGSDPPAPESADAVSDASPAPVSASLPNAPVPPPAPASPQRPSRSAPPGPRPRDAPPRRFPPGFLRGGIFGRRPRFVLASIATAAAILVTAFWFVQPRPGLWSASQLAWLAAGSTDRDVLEQIVLAEFGGPAADADLGSVVTDALRIDLLNAPVLRVLDPSEVTAILRQMQVETTTPFSAELAREVALRAGVKAVLDGEIAQAGTGYVLTAALRSAGSFEVLAAFRETASSPDEVIAAIDRLSRRIRQRAGESLESVHATPALGRVTTASLDALRLYTRADRAAERAEYHRVLALLDEALELDPEFAMAWRLLAVTLNNTGLDRTREVEAATRAYELRRRLSSTERYLAEAKYHSGVKHDHTAAIEAYRHVLGLAPAEPKALNNLAVLYYLSNDYPAAAELLERYVDSPGASAVAFGNLVRVRIAQGRLDAAWRAAELFNARFPEHPEATAWRLWALLLSGDTAGARAQLEPFLDDPALSPLERSWTHDHLARLALWRGRLDEARDHLETAERIARDAGGIHDPLIWRLRRAHVEVTVGDPERGIALIRDAVAQESFEAIPAPDRRYQLQAMILGMAGRTTEMETALRRYEDEVPAALRGTYRTQHESARAILHLRRGDPAQAVRILEGVRRSYPCRFCLADRMGWALREAGRLEEAAHEWETALAWKDSFNHIGFRLAQHLWMLPRMASLYEETGDTTRAVLHHRQLTELWADADPELQPRVEHARQRVAALLAHTP